MRGGSDPPLNSIATISSSAPAWTSGWPSSRETWHSQVHWHIRDLTETELCLVKSDLWWFVMVNATTTTTRRDMRTCVAVTVGRSRPSCKRQHDSDIIHRLFALSINLMSISNIRFCLLYIILCTVFLRSLSSFNSLTLGKVHVNLLNESLARSPWSKN